MVTCRALTFINYHIPVKKQQDMEFEYITLGTFEGMHTEVLNLQKYKNSLGVLWEYGIDRNVKSNGKYSFQNLFCFCNSSDEEVWREEAEVRYPLTFVVMLQLKNYVTEQPNIDEQCQIFNEIIRGTDKDILCNTYYTIDKNDFVVVIKSDSYRKGIKAIKSLHQGKTEVVYSYSILAVANKNVEVLAGDLEEKHPLYQESVDSICVKGIANTFDNKVCIEDKYNKFCQRFASVLKLTQTDDYKTYDILGTNDFRFIARNVNLGRVLKEYSRGGLLHYNTENMRSYLYSIDVDLNVLNSWNGQCQMPKQQNINTGYCDALQTKMDDKIVQCLKSGQSGYDANQKKILSYSNALLQLLNSLKAIEIAPTKKYDFWSLYDPLGMMIDIINQKLSGGDAATVYRNVEIYDFIQKISATMHSSLRTDIQFYQSRDYNVILHYAPAKLRAFYSHWTLELSDYYNCFSDFSRKYSFIVSPGVFKETSVKQLYKDKEELRRLMLVTVPEQDLYAPSYLAIVLSHEVSHFVGTGIRKREVRFEKWLKCCARILQLEMNKYRYESIATKWKVGAENGIRDLKLSSNIEKELFAIESNYAGSHGYHFEDAIRAIKADLKEMARTTIEKLVADNDKALSDYLKAKVRRENKKGMELIQEFDDIRQSVYSMQKYVLTLFARFQNVFLVQFLHMMHHFTSETFADMCAIMTLELKPEQYIQSFFGDIGDTVVNADEKREMDNKKAVRIAVTMYAINDAMKSYSGQHLSNEFVQAWSGDVFPETLQNTKTTPTVQDLALLAYGYHSIIINKNELISAYTSVYNYTDCNFSCNSYDFLKDRIIWECITEYLIECVWEYLNRLSETEAKAAVIRNKRTQIIKTYHMLSSGTVSDMIQEVELFLEKRSK